MLLMCMRLESLLQRLVLVIIFFEWEITKDLSLPSKGELWNPGMRGSAFKVVHKIFNLKLIIPH